MIDAISEGLRFIIRCIGYMVSFITTNASGKVFILPLFALGIAVSTVFLAIKLIRSSVWGN